MQLFNVDKIHRPSKTYKTGGKKSKVYNSSIITLDIETTSLFSNRDGSIRTTTDLEPRDELLKYYACMYHWQTSIDGTVYYGRTMDELKKYFKWLLSLDGIKIIWIHNLSFEFQFMLNALSSQLDIPMEVFARSRRKPIKVLFGSLEFRCTYMLTNAPLSKVGKMFNLPVSKAEGDLDYSLARGYTTPLTKKEQGYCEYDCLVIHELIKHFLKLYKRLDTIPLTSTGRIRRECEHMMLKHKGIRARICKEYPDVYMYEILRKLFAGGYTHSNYINTGYTLADVDSFDLSSSYPAAMVSERYPSSRFMPDVDMRIRKNPKYIYAYHIKLYDVEAKSCMSYLSYSRVEACMDAQMDNGRIRSAVWVEAYLTDIDVEIVQENYNYSKMEVLEMWHSTAKYLPKPLLEYIFKLYEDKTTLKGVEGKEDEYAQAKAFINSLYGMMVTNDIRDEVLFDINSPVNWTVRELSRDEISEALYNKSQSYKTFLLYQWGVWITAYARKNLWYMINRVDTDLVYTDTDSIKLVHSETHLGHFEHFNELMTKKIEKSIRVNELDVNYPPIDQKGRERPMGVYEHEDEYPVPQFKTLGAKKYCYKGKDGKLHLTLSGVQKKAVDLDPTFNSLKDFEIGHVFDAGYSGRLISRYIENQEPFEFYDYLGNLQRIDDQQFVINLQPTSYEIGITIDYFELLHNSTHLGAFNETDEI